MARPDGEGCIGKWNEYTANSACSNDDDWCPNSEITVIAVGDLSPVLTTHRILQDGSWPPQCSEQAGCFVGQYCDHNYMCSDCGDEDLAATTSCDALEPRSCCSDEFLAQCPSNPFSCNKATVQIFFYNPR
jgi:hypothetical protein